MTQLGCNLSEPLLALLRGGQADVDWIKLSRPDVLAEELALARPLRPVLLHVLPHAGVRSLDSLPLSWDELNAVIRTCASPHMAIHLEAHAEDFAGPFTDRDVLERMVANIATLAARLEVPLLVENVPYHGPSRLIPECCVAPQVVTEICERTGTGMLLDLAHVRVSASHRGEDAYSYLRAMPLDRVREIHVCGPAEAPDGRLRDRHLEMRDEDYALLGSTLGATRAEVVTLEYAGTGPLFEGRSDPTALERQLTQLRQMSV